MELCIILMGTWDGVDTFQPIKSCIVALQCPYTTFTIPNRIPWLHISTLVEKYKQLVLSIDHYIFGSDDPTDVLETTDVVV